MKRLLIGLAIVLGLLVGYTPNGYCEKTYEETVAGWTSYKDVEKWMIDNFTYDWSRLMSKPASTLPPKTVFKIKSGVCHDGARFICAALNHINPDYDAKMVWLVNTGVMPGDDVHYVSSFWLEGKLYIMDYATIHSDTRGTHGPYNSLEEYRNFYAGHHPGNKSASWPFKDKPRWWERPSRTAEDKF
ncbi:MAG: transglutaminase-like domain-containing protein [Candidatus Bathyarchaeia archaeon]|jgi:hypothetical protein